MAWHRARNQYAHPAGRNRLPWLCVAASLCFWAPPSGSQDDAEAPDDDASNAAPTDIPAAETVDDPLVTRFEANLAFDRLVENEAYEAAEAVGRRWVDLTIDEFGAQSSEAGEAYVSLAEVQSRAGEFTSAEENFLVAVEIYRNSNGIYSDTLLRPLLGLGDNYYADGQYLNAVSAYNEARTVSRRVNGLLNENQIPILDRMTRAFTNLNEYTEADEQQLEALKLVERNHPEQSSAVLEGIYKYARWLRDSRRYSEEREQYARAGRIIRDHYGDNDVRMAKPLRETGNSFRSQGAAVGQGISGLRQALEILETQEQPNPLTLAEVWRDIGDWQVAFSKVSPDGNEYRRAWGFLDAVPNGAELREAWFGGIEYVFREPLSQRGLSAAPDAPSGFVLVKFDLGAGGRTDNVEIVDADPRDFKEEAVARHVRLSRFRPHMRDGDLVVAPNLALQVTFRYAADEE